MPGRPRLATSIELRPITLRAANQHVSKHHRHHKPVRGCVFCISVVHCGEICGVVIVGRPVAPGLQDGVTFEVTRLCLIDGAPKNAASRLLGAAWRASKAMGVRRLVSYLRADESGDSYRAAGWVRAAGVKGREWNTGNKRERWLPGLYIPTTEIIDRTRWEMKCRNPT
jgi:hypothetical protein